MNLKLSYFLKRHSRWINLPLFFFHITLFYSCLTNATDLEAGKAAYLDRNYEDATKIFKPGGKIVVVTFHSLEDKILKFFFKSLSEKKSISRYMPKIEEKDNLFKIINKKPIVPSDRELKENILSRSAKLRFAIKEKDLPNFEKEILKKFNYLLEIENFS